jgi:hypothetical protein
MGWAIKRIAPSLRVLGFEVEFSRASGRLRERQIHLRVRSATTSETSGMSEGASGVSQGQDSVGRSPDVLDEGPEKRPSSKGPETLQEGPSDIPDVSDVLPGAPVVPGVGGEEEDEWTL